MEKYLVSYRMTVPGFLGTTVVESSGIYEAESRAEAIEQCVLEGAINKVGVLILSAEKI